MNKNHIDVWRKSGISIRPGGERTVDRTRSDSCGWASICSLLLARSLRTKPLVAGERYLKPVSTAGELFRSSTVLCASPN